MNKYVIKVNRYQTLDIEVEAEDFEAAREVALDKLEGNGEEWAKADPFYQTADENGNFED